MTIEELKQAVDDIDTGDIVAGVEDTKNALQMIVEKLHEIERRIGQSRPG